MARVWAALLLVAAVAATAFGQCTVTSNGYGFDLSKANNGNDASVVMGATGFNSLMNACRPLSSGTDSVCQATAYACQKYTSGGATYRMMANARTVVASGTATGVVVTYTGGDYCPTPQVYRSLVITFSCGTSATSLPTYVSESPSCQYNFNWNTIAGCGVLGGGDDDDDDDDDGGGGGGGGSSNIGGGDVFLIIFFVGGFLYVAIGMAYNYKFKGQTGVEMVPNIEFWRGLPSMLKDGFVFTGQKISGVFKKA